MAFLTIGMKQQGYVTELFSSLLRLGQITGAVMKNFQRFFMRSLEAQRFNFFLNTRVCRFP